MKARTSVLLIVGLLICGLITQPAQAIDKTDTGFYYPFGTRTSTWNNANWLAGWPGPQFKQYDVDAEGYPYRYHIGTDPLAPKLTPVYAVADGEVVWKNDSTDWGEGSSAIFIKHYRHHTMKSHLIILKM